MLTVDRVKKNAILLALANAVSQAVGFAVNVYVARRMGQSVFGQFAFAATFASYFTILGDPGISTLAQRELARHTEATREYAGSILLVRLVCSICALLAMSTLAILNFEGTKLTLTLVYGVASLAPALSLNWVFAAHERMEYVAGTAILTAVSYFGLVALALTVTDSLLLFPLSVLGSNLAGAVVSQIVVIRRWGGLSLRLPNNEFVRQLSTSVWPFALSGVVIATNLKLGTMILGFLGWDSEAGLYAAAFKLTHVLQILGAMYFASIYPALSRLHMSSKRELAVTVTKSLDLCASVAIPITVGGIIVAGPLVQWIYDDQFTGSTVVFQALLLAFLATSLAGTLAYYLMASERQGMYLVSNIVSLVGNATLCTLLIPRYGAYGAALAYSVAELVGLVLIYRQARQALIVRLPVHLVSPLLASSIMTIVILANRQLIEAVWWMQVLWGAVAYFLALVPIRAATNRLSHVVREPSSIG